MKVEEMMIDLKPSSSSKSYNVAGKKNAGVCNRIHDAICNYCILKENKYLNIV